MRSKYILQVLVRYAPFLTNAIFPASMKDSCLVFNNFSFFKSSLLVARFFVCKTLLCKNKLLFSGDRARLLRFLFSFRAEI